MQAFADNYIVQVSKSSDSKISLYVYVCIMSYCDINYLQYAAIAII